MEQFALLISLLRERLEASETKALNRSVAGAVIPELRLHCLLCWLAGGSFVDTASQVNVHPSTFCPIVRSTIAAVNTCEGLAFCFPDSGAMAAKLAQGFQSFSADGVVNGRTGVIEGWLMPTIVPPSRFGDITARFSGHCQRHGLSVQVTCNHRCRFLHVAVAAPGGWAA